MHDVADGQLLDVRGISIDELIADLINEENPALARAVERIRSSNAACNFNSFNSSI